MSTLTEVRAAEERMKKAQARMRAYVERPEDEPGDANLHRELAAALKETTAEYVRLASELQM